MPRYPYILMFLSSLFLLSLVSCAEDEEEGPTQAATVPELVASLGAVLYAGENTTFKWEVKNISRSDDFSVDFDLDTYPKNLFAIDTGILGTADKQGLSVEFTAPTNIAELTFHQAIKGSMNTAGTTISGSALAIVMPRTFSFNGTTRAVAGAVLNATETGKSFNYPIADVFLTGAVTNHPSLDGLAPSERAAVRSLCTGAFATNDTFAGLTTLTSGMAVRIPFNLKITSTGSYYFRIRLDGNAKFDFNGANLLSAANYTSYGTFVATGSNRNELPVSAPVNTTAGTYPANILFSDNGANKGFCLELKRPGETVFTPIKDDEWSL